MRPQTGRNGVKTPAQTLPALAIFRDFVYNNSKRRMFVFMEIGDSSPDPDRNIGIKYKYRC